MERFESLVSVGYEGVPLGDFVDRLVARGVDVLVDVRLNAISRKPGFSKRRLSEALGAAGIEYVHRPELGNDRDNRDGYADPASSAGVAARSRFRDRLDAPEAVAAIEDLVERSRTARVAVFCYEAHERHCHREQVVERAREVVVRRLVGA